MSKTLVCTKPFLPYQEGDVFTVTDKEWAGMLSEQPDKERDQKINPLLRNCVEEYNPDDKKHVALLEAQRGKPADEDTEPVATAEVDARVAELEAQLESEKANRAAAEQAAADAEKAKADAEQRAADVEKAAKAAADKNK